MTDQPNQTEQTQPQAPADAEGGAATATQEKPPVPSTEPKSGYWWGTGRRKTAVARVRIRPGEGQFLINSKPVDEFFTELQYRNDVRAPLEAAQLIGQMDVTVNVQGGGPTGQAGAVVLGLARALKQYDLSLEDVLREKGYLTRDAREVERKKYGQPGARRQFQFSKR